MSRRRWTRRPRLATSSPWRSGLEESIAADLTNRGVRFAFEEMTIEFLQPPVPRKYTPDFVIGKLIIESKGYFEPEDRKKHLWIKEQHPEMDIRFVFSNPNNPIRKGSKTRYRDWCDKNGFKWAAKTVPQEWLNDSQAD